MTGYHGSGLSLGPSHSHSGLQYPAASGDTGERKVGDTDSAYLRLHDRPGYRLNCYGRPNDTYCR